MSKSDVYLAVIVDSAIYSSVDSIVRLDIYWAVDWAIRSFINFDVNSAIGSAIKEKIYE